LVDQRTLSTIHRPGQRLFFALWPDAGLSREINRLGEEVQGHGGRLHHPADLHMTLVFLGPVDPEQLPCIEQVADEILAESFGLSLDRIDYWPRPRILLLGSSETPEPLAALVKGLQAGLVECGFRPEKRPFRPHVTLARKARQVAASTLEQPLSWRPHEFVLAGSSMEAEPPRYRILKRWPLG